MKTNKTVFAQLMDHISHYEFDKHVKRYNGHYKVHRFTSDCVGT